LEKRKNEIKTAVRRCRHAAVHLFAATLSWPLTWHSGSPHLLPNLPSPGTLAAWLGSTSMRWRPAEIP
jgi:hypothetical protein